MTSETNAGIGGFIGSAATNTNSQGMTTITANVDPIQSKVTFINRTLNINVNYHSKGIVDSSVW